MYRIVARSLLLALLCVPTALAIPAQEELANDGWSPGATAGFQAGFQISEIGAVRLTPSITCPCDLNKVSLLFGGAAGPETVTLIVYDDDVGSVPGTVLHSADYVLNRNDNALQDIDLSSGGISVNGAFWVGIRFQHAGTPSIARDDDGDINATANYIFTGGNWF